MKKFVSRIGLLSDSHGRAVTTQLAVKCLLDQGAELLLHLGDVGSLEVIDALVMVQPGQSEPVPVRLVFGNVDWDHAHLGRYARNLGLMVDHPVGRISLEDGRSLIFLHGDDAEAMTRALADKPAYLCHGHSHRMLDQRVGSTRIINPGALFRASQYSVALLDSQNDKLHFLPVPAS